MMKKFLFALIAMFGVFTMSFAQEQSNYSGSSKFTDNISATVQWGVGTPFSKISGDRLVYDYLLIGVDKYITPVFGVGIEGRTTIGSFSGPAFNHTVFDHVNVSGLLKANLANAVLGFNGERRVFEPVLYTGVGWGHQTCSDAIDRNWMTYRAGLELNFHATPALAITLNPGVVWGDLDNGKLAKSHGAFEVSVGLTYHFKSSNGKRTFSKPVLYDAAEVNALYDKITELQNRQPEVQTVEKIVEVEKTVPTESTFVVQFAKNKSELTDEAKANLDNVTGTVKIVASASPEGGATYNQHLSEARANAVKEYLEARGVKVEDAAGVGAIGNASNRIAIITIQ
jgi:outer membrane protein OmpA-like peptidoglycan-associated protein